jgi:hypothetical protein
MSFQHELVLVVADERVKAERMCFCECVFVNDLQVALSVTADRVHGRTGSSAARRRCNGPEFEFEADATAVIGPPPGTSPLATSLLRCWTSHSPQSKAIKYDHSSTQDNQLVSTETASAAVWLTILQASS